MTLKTVFLVTFLWLLPRVPLAIAQSSRTVEIGSVQGIHGIPVYLAKIAAQKRGLNLDLVDFNSGGTPIIQSILGGSLNFGIAFYDHAVSMQVRHKDLVCVVLMTRFPAAALAVRTDAKSTVHSLADLKGHKVGVPGLNSSGDLMLKYWLTKAGVAPDQVPVVAVGGTGTAIAALENKSVDAVFVNDPAATIMVERHLANLLVDGRSEAGSRAAFGGTYPSNCLFVTKSFADEHPDVVQDVVNSFVEALHMIQRSTSAQIVAQLPLSWIVGDAAQFAQILDANRQIYSATGRMEPEDATGFGTVGDLLSIGDPVVKRSTIDYDRTYNNRFVDEAAKNAPATLGH